MPLALRLSVGLAIHAIQARPGASLTVSGLISLNVILAGVITDALTGTKGGGGGSSGESVGNCHCTALVCTDPPPSRAAARMGERVALAPTNYLGRAACGRGRLLGGCLRRQQGRAYASQETRPPPPRLAPPRPDAHTQPRPQPKPRDPAAKTCKPRPAPPHAALATKLRQASAPLLPPLPPCCQTMLQSGEVHVL